MLIEGRFAFSLFRKSWWDNALKTPIFKEEFSKIYKTLKEKELDEFALSLEFASYNFLILFKNQIEYKLGSTMIKYSKIKYGLLKLPFVLAKIALKYKIAKIIYELLSLYNPKFKEDNVEQILQRYEKHWQILKAKEHLSYRFGVALIKAHKTWYKGGYIKLFKELKAIKKDFYDKEAICLN